jgi:hypothetical protein
MHHNQVAKWRRRYIRGGLGALQDEPRSGRKGSIGTEVLRQIVDQATRPPQGRACWTCRARWPARWGVSKATVQRVWSHNKIRPHLTRVFKLSTDPDFEAKFWDVIGLYLNPSEQAVVLCCDEKSQIQALQRSQPGLPLGRGHIRTQTHDYYRNGIPNVPGLVMTPFSADAAAVSGLTRHTLSSRVPDRPGKFRGTVRKLIVSVAGAWPMPMHPLQPA